MNSWARISAGFAGRTRAFLHLTLRRSAYAKAMAEFPAISGPAVVVGSALEPHRPEGVTPDWFVISVNASQVTADDFALGTPDLTVFRDGIFLSDTHQDAVWSALRGKRTAHLAAIMGSSEETGAAAAIVPKDYRADRVTELNRHIRGAIIAEMSGLYHVHLGGHNGVSNGLFATLLALKLGAAPVVMSGFSFAPGWNFAKDIPGERGHIPVDRAICNAIVARGLPVYAADPGFAEKSGLPLWTGAIAKVAQRQAEPQLTARND